MKPFPIWCDKCAKQNECHIGDCVPKCYEPKNEPKRNMAEDIVESFGFKIESYRQAKAKTEPQQVTSKLASVENSTVSACESTMGQPKGKLEDEPQTENK